MKIKFAVLLGCLVLFSCNKQGDKESADENPVTVTPKIPAPEFNADSAYAYIQKQVDFGPRVPGTAAHAKCAGYLQEKLKSDGFSVILQTGNARTFDGKQFTLKNIIGSFKPEIQRRIMICSHWDSRPFAEEDDHDKDKPIDGANDGASGVGVALELARQISLKNPSIGVDIIFFDLEDYGTNGSNDSWCIGSRYWSENLHRPNYYADFGVLLDMVGGPGAIFPKEGHSVEYASSAVDKVWNTASALGYGNHFVSRVENFVGSDDHIAVNKAGIPCIDIIEFNPETGGFGFYHHTHDDNMSGIDKSTLKAVGQTLTEVIYSEK